VQQTIVQTSDITGGVGGQWWRHYPGGDIRMKEKILWLNLNTGQHDTMYEDGNCGETIAKKVITL